MNEWINSPTATQIEDFQGFVYEIINLKTGMYYIGKKNFWAKTCKKPLKGRKNKRRGIKESDWKSYWGSSPKLLADVEKYGQDGFERRMLFWCKSKFELAYIEGREQFNRDVLFDKTSYNEIINMRIRRWNK